MDSRLETAVRAARAAGKILYDTFDTTLQVRSKGERDLVTNADYAAEQAVRTVLLEHWPQDRFLSEELEAAARQALWDEAAASGDVCLWVVDPLDGTTNYAHHMPTFSVSIALVRGGAVELGVVYDPMRNELFTAERGGGAHLNGKRMSVSSIPTLAEALIGTDWAHAQPVRDRTADLFGRMARRAMAARSTGSAAISLCYIAAGRLDAYFHLSLFPWDVAAAAFLVEEAGGRVTTPAGAAWNIHSQSYVATNGHLHSQMLDFFQNP